MARQEIVVKKIHLEGFIDMLIQAHNAGADYIDMIAIAGAGPQDGLGIIINEDYIDFERCDDQKYVFEFLPEDSEKVKMTKSDIQQLLNQSLN